MSCHPARGWGNWHPQSLHRRRGSRRRTQSICHNKRQHWCLLFLNIWHCWPFISCFLGAQPAYCRSQEVVYTKQNISNITEAPVKRKRRDRPQKKGSQLNSMIYSHFYSFNSLLIWKTFIMELELHKIYNVILENVTNIYEALRLLTEQELVSILTGN